MEVLSHGERYHRDEIFICPECACVFSASSDEYKYVLSSRVILTAICPECGEEAYKEARKGSWRIDNSSYL